MINVNWNDLRLKVSHLSGVQIDDIKEDTALIEDLQLSSLKFVELMAIVGEDYGVTINEDDAMNLHTVGNLYQLIKAEKNIALS